MAEHPHIAVFRRAMEAFASGDTAAPAEVFDPDVVWRLGGRSPMAGHYRGRDATFAMFALDFELSGGTYRTQLRDVLANDDHTVALLHATAERAGKRLDMDYVIDFRIRNDRIVEGSEFWAEPSVYDEFWS